MGPEVMEETRRGIDGWETEQGSAEIQCFPLPLRRQGRRGRWEAGVRDPKHDTSAPIPTIARREDLARQGQTFDSPIWTYDPAAAFAEAAARGGGDAALEQLLGNKASHHPETWKVSVWQLDSGTSNFMAVRALARPPPEWLRVFSADGSRTHTE